LDIINDFFSFFPWYLINVFLAPKCVHSHHIHANERGTIVIDLKPLSEKHLPLHIVVHHQLSHEGVVAHETLLE
jgi:hypothetical protein